MLGEIAQLGPQRLGVYPLEKVSELEGGVELSTELAEALLEAAKLLRPLRYPLELGLDHPEPLCQLFDRRELPVHCGDPLVHLTYRLGLFCQGVERAQLLGSRFGPRDEGLERGGLPFSSGSASHLRFRSEQRRQ